MTARPKSGIRRIDDTAEGSRIAWLYGPTDLDDVLAELARTEEEPWTETEFIAPDQPHPEISPGQPTEDEWSAYFAACDGWRAAGAYRIGEDRPTSLANSHEAELEVGWFRQMPWCHCGEGHTWHWERAAQGSRGASLAVLMSSGW